MRPILALTLLVTSTAFAQRPDQPTYGSVDRPAVDRSAATAKVTELERVVMTDYEVWVAEDASKNRSFTLFIETEYGWFEVTEGTTFPHTQVKVFGSEDAAEEYLALAIAAGLEVRDFFVKSKTPDTVWVYFDTYDTRAEASEALAVLLAFLGDDFVGDVRSVTVIPKGLR